MLFLCTNHAANGSAFAMFLFETFFVVVFFWWLCSVTLFSACVRFITSEFILNGTPTITQIDIHCIGFARKLDLCFRMHVVCVCFCLDFCTQPKFMSVAIFYLIRIDTWRAPDRNTSTVWWKHFHWIFGILIQMPKFNNQCVCFHDAIFNELFNCVDHQLCTHSVHLVYSTMYLEYVSWIFAIRTHVRRFCPVLSATLPLRTK